MNEDFLSFVWRFQYFENQPLFTEERLPVSVLRTGNRNADAGPDFVEARLSIGDVMWAGSIEIHTRSSHWYEHHHQENPVYENVILHVVWENDRQVIRQDGTLLPTIVLKNRVNKEVLQRYIHLQDEKETIPCAASFPGVDNILKFDMLDRVLMERLERKAGEVAAMLEASKNDWDEVAYCWLTRHYGFKLNDQSFQCLAQILPWKILRKHRDNIFQMEALLFGCAGLIPDMPDEPYVRQLRHEYHFLAAKHRLKKKMMAQHEWKYARLHPAGFPTVRIAQLAQLLGHEAGLFSRLISTHSVPELMNMLQTRQSNYWTEHYIFNKKSRGTVPVMGKDAAAMLIINGVAPLMVAYSKHRAESDLLHKAVYFLTQLSAENNRITRHWKLLGMKVHSAADSQSLIEWNNNYCAFRKCLECKIGASLIRPSPSPD